MQPSPTKQQKQIDSISEQDSNLLVPLSQIPVIWAQYKQFTQVTKGIFYPYNQKYDDFGWGCAWRAIQTLLSAQNVKTQFKELVVNYRSKHTLWGLLQNQWGNECTLKDLSWAPQENTNCWAEPFIASIICKDFKLKSKLKLVNGYPKAYAPQFVFQQTLNFQNFWEFVKKHIPQSPIMIDDSQLAMSIIGYKQGSNKEKHLLLADPHITTNRSKETKKTGIYEVVVSESGKQIRNDVEEEAKILYPFNSFQKIQFQEKKWMVCAIDADEMQPGTA